MKHYLSMGFGVNSVALYLLMQDLGMEFEAVYVDHGADWPETAQYVEMFRATHPVTVIIPEYEGHSSLLEYCKMRRMTPSRVHRWCTSRFKVRPLNAYFETPCFVHLGIDSGEIRRARFTSEGGRENRYLLIEEGIDRDGCKNLIRRHGLVVPPKSGCWFCPYQRLDQWRRLRRDHPDLFCEAQKLEVAQNEYRTEVGKAPFYIRGESTPLGSLINDRQASLPGFEEVDYPPCQCAL